MDWELQKKIDRAFEGIYALDKALERGEIDEEGWHQGYRKLLVPSYLKGDNPRAQSGFGGDEARWEGARRPIVDALDRNGTFLDVGCASGLLMESIHAWSAERGLSIEPYGIDIAPELVELAQNRLPHWADRIHVGNGFDWQTPQRFTFIRTDLIYVPKTRRLGMIRHLYDDLLEPGGRLIIGIFSEITERRVYEEQVSSWEFKIAGRIEIPHPSEPRITRRLFWIEK